MLKKLLMSSLILGALAATMGAGALSAWTDSTTATGTLAAADIELQAWDAGNNQYQDGSTFTFSPGILVPGQSANGTTYLKNAGNADLNVTMATPAVTVTFGDTGCAGYLDVTASGVPGALAPGGESGPITITATLNSGTPQVCEAASFSVALTFNGATQY